MRFDASDSECDSLDDALATGPFGVISDVEPRVQHQGHTTDGRPDDFLGCDADSQSYRTDEEGGVTEKVTGERSS